MDVWHVTDLINKWER